MFTRSIFTIMLAVLAGALLTAGCGGSAGAPAGDDGPGLRNDPQHKPGPGDRSVLAGTYNGEYDDPSGFTLAQYEWDMIFGQTMNLGDAALVESGGQWYMRYTLTAAALADGWRYCGAHVHVWTGGNPPKGSPGQFDYKWTYDGTEADLRISYDLALGSFNPNAGSFNIAIHGVICKWGITGYDDLGNPIYGEVANETGWGGYWDAKDGDHAAHWTGNWKNKWGGWMSSSDQEVAPVFAHYTANYTGWHFGPSSYWRVRFSPDGPYPFPGANDWVGWCTDPRYYASGVPVNVEVYSCYDPNLPNYAKSENWDFISYMIDQRRSPDAGGPFAGVNWSNDANKQAFQDAVWYFKYGPDTEGGYPATLDNTWYVTIADGSLADSFVDYALAHGQGYYPNEPGEWYAVVLFPISGYNGNRGTLDPGFQMNIIEVDP